MARAWTFKVGNVTVMPELHHPCRIEFIDKSKLYNVPRIAVEMIERSIEQIDQL